MQIDKLTVAYGDKTEDFFVKAIRLSARAKMLDDHRLALKNIDVPGAAGPNVLAAKFTANFIAQSVVDENGTQLFKPEDIEDWHPAKITAYEKAIVKYQNPTLEAAAKNSETTPSAAT